MKAYMARQPIYTAQRSIYGYELLYRSDAEQVSANFTDGNKATRTVVSDAVLAFGLERLTNGKPAFVNFGKDLIMSNLIDMIDKYNFIIEILEDTEVDEEFVQRIKEKYEEGYLFALDDYTGDECFTPIMPYVKIVKVDFYQVKGRALRRISEKLTKINKIMLAEKVETAEEFKLALKYKYTYFQGYYFEKPMVLTTNVADVQSSTCVRVLNELSSDVLSFNKLAEIIRTDINLTYRLMKHTNSLQFYRGHEINSVQLALVCMGIEEVKRWATLVFLRDVSGNENEEITKDALVRATLAEWVAKRNGLNTEIAFLAGMFSMIDTITNDNLQSIISQIAVSPIIKDALFGVPGPYTDILQFVCAYESGNWDTAMQYATLHRLHIDELSKAYINAVKYADSLFDS